MFVFWNEIIYGQYTHENIRLLGSPFAIFSKTNPDPACKNWAKARRSYDLGKSTRRPSLRAHDHI